MSNDPNAPLTKGDLQTILNHITRENRRNDNLINQLSEDVSQLKDDMSIIASILGLKRNQRGKLTKIA